MTRDEALERLRELGPGYEGRDPESGHEEADKILLDLLNDPEVTEAFEAIVKWYS